MLLLTRCFAAVLFVVLALSLGCGIDDAPLAQPFREEVTTLLDERTFTQGSVEVEEQIQLTNADRSQIFHLRARLTNLGPDIPQARYELVFQRQLDTVTGGVILRDPVVVATEDIGTLHSSQTALVSLSYREFGSTRVYPSGRLSMTPSVIPTGPLTNL